MKCKDCNKELSESSQAMTCDICQRWLCRIQCLEVPEDSLQKYLVLQAMLPVLVRIVHEQRLRQRR